MDNDEHDKRGLEPHVHDVDDSRVNRSNNRVQDYRPTQALERYITFLPTIAFDATLTASWEAMVVSFQAALLNGGPNTLVWGTLLAWIGSTSIAASLGEMASINPTVGAQYRWTGLYAPRGFLSPAFWSLLQGWITVFAWIAVCAQVCFLEGTIVQALIALNNPDYVPKLWHGTLLAWAILAIPLFCNLFTRKILAPLEVLGGIFHIALFIVFVVVLVVMSPRSSASFVFTSKTEGFSGWDNYAIEWCIGLLSAAFPLAAFDGVIHMSAEVKDAPRRVPQSMVSSVAINGTLMFAMVIVILFTIGDLETVLQNPYPIVAILYNSTGSTAATTVLMTFIIFMGLVAMFGTLASVSRLTWAFARDKGLPFSGFFERVHPTLNIPLNALMLVSVITILLTLINLGSTTAFFAILSLNTLALYISYITPMIFFLIAKLRGQYIPFGPFRLGKAGYFINVFAICYAIFIVIFLPFPPFLPVTKTTMNYGGPVMGFVILFAIADYVISGRKRFRVPVDQAELEMEDRMESKEA